MQGRQDVALNAGQARAAACSYRGALAASVGAGPALIGDVSERDTIRAASARRASRAVDVIGRHGAEEEGQRVGGRVLTSKSNSLPGKTKGSTVSVSTSAVSAEDC